MPHYGSVEGLDSSKVDLKEGRILEDATLPAKKTATNARSTWLGGLLVGIVFVVGAFYTRKNGVVSESTALDSSLEGNGWFFYKTTMVTKNGTSGAVLEFMMNFTGGYDCAKVGLGCDGYKITCTYGKDMKGIYDISEEVHYVHAPELFSQAVDKDNLGVDGWQDITEMSMANMDKEFTAFMHNKIQMYTQNVDERAAKLESAGYKVMRRLSYWKDGKTLLAHASTQLSGHIWEFVGLAPKDVTDWTFWKINECPKAHSITADIFQLEKYIDEINSKAIHSESAYDRINTTFWISSHVASSIDNDRTSMLNDLKDLTRANINTENSDACEVTTVTHKYYDQISLKYVKNAKKQAASVDGETYSLAMFEDYINQVHEKYLLKPNGTLHRDRWRNWDHWLDRHVGMAIEQKHDYCMERNEAITARLLDKDTPVGKRAIGSEDHFYVGYYNSSFTLEYNVNCHSGVGETNVCTCNHENSNELGNNTDTSCDGDDTY